MKLIMAAITGLGIMLGVASASVSSNAPPTTINLTLPLATDNNITVQTLPRDTADGLEFVGPAFSGGENVTLHGTPEDIYNQLVDLNPDYSQDFPEEPEKEDSGETGTDADSNDDDFVRGDYDKYHWIKCDTSRRADHGRIREGIKYLSKIKGECAISGNRCSRVSCSHESAVWWCNIVRFHVAFAYMSAPKEGIHTNL